MDPEAAYYQTVEEVFASLRGDPLFLTNPDWLLVRRWREVGIPLRIVLRGIRDALEAHAHSWGRHRKVKSLAYCAPEVEAAHQHWQRAVAGGGEAVDHAQVLLGFAHTLENARGLGAAAQREAAQLSEALREKAQEGLDLMTAEPWLQRRERRLLECLQEDLGARAMEEIEAAVRAVLTPYLERMPEPVLASIRAESMARRLLEAHGLPRLSFFHASR